MPTLEQGLESLANRGHARGADSLTESLDLELSAAEAGSRSWSHRRKGSDPVSLRRGLAIAVAASAVVLLVGGIGVIASTLNRDIPQDAASSPVTIQAPSDTSPLVERLFDGIVVRDGDVLGVFQDAQFVPLVEGECCVGNALADRAGGVVFQRDEGAILWAGGGRDTRAVAPEVLVEAAGGERVSLEGVEVIGGEPTVMYLRSAPTAQGEQSTLATIGLVSQNRSNVVVLGTDDVAVDRVSYSGGLYVISLDDGEGTWFEFRDESGGVVTVPNNPRPVPGDTLVSQGLLTDGGSVMVFIERRPEDVGGGLADLVTLDLDRGVELTRNHIADFGDRIVTFDGDRVLITRRRANPKVPPLIIGLHLSEGATFSSDGGFSVDFPAD